MPVFEMRMDIINGEYHNEKTIYIAAKDFDEAVELSKKLMTKELCHPVYGDYSFHERDWTRAVKLINLVEASYIHLPSVDGVKKYNLVLVEEL